jgi:protein tyrosine phosphatase (PTP) superfamily phosphohydrolase (DUF442 family)
MSLNDAISGAPNGALPLPWLATAGQPSAADFAAAHAAGVTTVIDLRDPMEPRPFDEAGTLRELGMTYINVPVVSGALSDQVMEKVLAAVRAHANEPTILHCASANRVGGALIPYFIIDQGMEEQAAVDAAMAVGLRSAELMEWGLEYARRHG